MLGRSRRLDPCVRERVGRGGLRTALWRAAGPGSRRAGRGGAGGTQGSVPRSAAVPGPRRSSLGERNRGVHLPALYSGWESAAAAPKSGAAPDREQLPRAQKNIPSDVTRQDPQLEMSHLLPSSHQKANSSTPPQPSCGSTGRHQKLIIFSL